MNNVLARIQWLTLDRLLLGNKPELAQGIEVWLQETLVHPLIITGLPHRLPRIPQNFTDTDAFAKPVKQVEEQLRHLRLLHQVAYCVSELHVVVIITGGDHRWHNSRHRQFAGTKHTGVMEVPLLHLFCQDEVITGISVGGIAQYSRQTARG